MNNRHRQIYRTAPYRFFHTLLLLSLITASGCALLYRDLKAPTVELIGIQPEGLQNDLSLRVLTRLRLTNPNTVALPIEGGRLEMMLNGQAVADSVLTEDLLIAANGHTDIDVRVNIQLATALAVGLNALSSQQAEMPWQLKGHIDVGTQYLGRVPIKESGTVSLSTGRVN